jgi:hypothetical protein
MRIRSSFAPPWVQLVIHGDSELLGPFAGTSFAEGSRARIGCRSADVG